MNKPTPPAFRRAVFPTAVSVLAREGASESDPIKVHALVSTTDVARDGGIIENWSLENYRKNPVILFSHDSAQPVIGRATNVHMTAAGLEMDVEFTDERTYPYGHMLGKLVAGRWMQAFSVGFSLVSERQPSDAEKARGARWVGTGELYEVSLVAVPADPNALAAGGRAQLTPKEVAIAKAQFSSIDGWAPLLRSLEDSLEAAPVEPPPNPSDAPATLAPGTTASSTSPALRAQHDHAACEELRDLLSRGLELLLDMHGSAEGSSGESTLGHSFADRLQRMVRDEVTQAMRAALQEARAAKVEEASPTGSLPSSSDLHQQLLEAVRRGYERGSQQCQNQ